jgi:hypothetical protein
VLLFRWKFGHPESVDTAAMDGLKEEMENTISAVRALIKDLNVGSAKCFEVDREELEREGERVDVHEDDDISSHDVFEAAYHQLYSKCSGTPLPEEVALPIDEDDVFSIRNKRNRRLLKRYNIRTIMCLSTYSHSDFATNHMLDKMWTTALK